MKHRDVNKPDNDLQRLPPTVELETMPVMRKLVQARALLAEMKGIGETIPNQAMLINTLTLREAKGSSEIENIITTQDELHLAFAVNQGKTDPQVKEVLNYQEALWFGFQLIKEKELLTTRDIADIQSIIEKNNAGIRRNPGTQLKNARTGEVIYTPPTGERVIRDLMQNLEQYINVNEDEMDPLIKMAVIHYQFESIHPFYDGNGRTGRIINILYLVMQGLLDLPVLYMSSYIIKHKQDYYRLLQEVRTKESWEEWVLFFLNAVELTAKETISYIKKSKELLEATIATVKKELPGIYSKELVETIFEQPYCRAGIIVEKGLYERRTAMKYLRELTRIGIMREVPLKNQVLFLNINLQKLLQSESELK